mgnify:FL=1
MTKKLLLSLLLLLAVRVVAQEHNSRFSLGFNYGFGSEFNNRNYTFTNHFYKAQYYKIKEANHFNIR